MTLSAVPLIISTGSGVGRRQSAPVGSGIDATSNAIAANVPSPMQTMRNVMMPPADMPAR
jgi:hypothetical protein